MDTGMHVAQGPYYLTEFWKKYYLKEFVADGFSKIKFVTGKPASGKTYVLEQIKKDAEELNYLTVHISANDGYINDFKDFYVSILSQIDISERLYECSGEVLRKLNKDPDEVPKEQSPLDYFSSISDMGILLRSEMRQIVADMFLQDTMMDHYFANVCALICGSYLGLFELDETGRNLMLGWMAADKSVKLSALKPYGISPCRITKLNARHMLRSLCEVVRMAGYTGICVLVDDLDVLQDKYGNGIVKYTKMKRDDTYESIRQLIDEIDTLHNIMFVFAFDRILIDNEKAGLKSYQALWMRIQNEISSNRFNCFTDIADLDRLVRQTYSDEYLMEMALQFAEEGEKEGLDVQILDEEQLRQLREQARYSDTGLAGMIRQEVRKEIQ